MTGIPVHRAAVLPEWIDYNGHLRDAYYVLIVSEATDALMDRIGLDAAYRRRTGCTLYTVEMHLHYLQEVKLGDTVCASVRILGADRKRLHALFELTRTGSEALVATAELMLLHVRQAETTAAAELPDEVSAAIGRLPAAAPSASPGTPGSRRMELRGGARAS